MRTWRFEAMDTWFFRESRGHDSLGVSELASVFPPPARTLAGAIRTAVGESCDVDWAAWRRTKGECDLNLKAAIGFGDDLGAMKLIGPFLSRRADERLYPWPRHLLEHILPDSESQKTDIQHKYARLHLGPVLHTHLGRVHAPALPAGQVGFKAPENAWLTLGGLRRVLDGRLPEVGDVVRAPNLYAEEARLGIALEAGTHTAKNGKLYQTRHIRPQPELALEADVTGLDALTPPNALLRLGGEGRAAGFRTQAGGTSLPTAPASTADDAGLLLLLLTPAALGGWLPPGFAAEVRDGLTTWAGEIAGIRLRIHAAVCGKPQREGGWDMARNRPRPVCGLLPAGSIWFCTAEDGTLAQATSRLHGTQVGHDTALGRGLLAVGRWPAEAFIEQN